MKCRVLTEDAPAAPGFEAEHGASFYFEKPLSTGGTRRFLFDFGTTDVFLRNARRFGLDLSAVDVAFLSHGHRDHSGGLRDFLSTNAWARVFANRRVFRPYFSLRKGGVFAEIGTTFPEEFAERIVATDAGVVEAEPGAVLFSDVATNEARSEANDALFEVADVSDDADDADFNGETVAPRVANVAGKCVSLRRDRFLHEQNLILTTESGRTVLVVGCAHRGIVNIMNRCVEILGRAPDVAIGGFHLMVPSRGETIPVETLDDIANRLKSWPKTRYLTGHCAGRAAFDRVRETLGDRIEYFGAGSAFEL